MIRWLGVVLDRPARDLEPAAEFWAAAAGAVARPVEPAELGGFAESGPPSGAPLGFTLGSERGDDYVSVQSAADPPGGLHLNLFVDDVQKFVSRAREAGAEPVADRGSWRLLASPAGLPFRVGRRQGQTRRPGPFAGPGGASSRLHQACLDIAPSRFEAEVDFWTALTGWQLNPIGLPVFSRLTPPPPVPVRILLQRLGEERPASAHLDVSCADIPATRAWHESMGATFVGEWEQWTTLTDPAGGVYCLTAGDPATD